MDPTYLEATSPVTKAEATTYFFFTGKRVPNYSVFKFRVPAYCDGIRNDAANFQSILDAANPGGTVFIPPGDYYTPPIRRRRSRK